MPLKLEYTSHTLDFTFDAGTSRGVMREKSGYFIRVSDKSYPTIFGLGEAAPLRGLSVELLEDIPDALKNLQTELETVNAPTTAAGVYNLVHQLVPSDFPSVRFALETALLDLLHGGERLPFPGDFSRGNKSIAINGLIWMGDKKFMLEQIKAKLDAGYTCLKMKIGAIDFDTELEILAGIRKQFSPGQITLRVDVNGAFKANEALAKLAKLEPFGLHSIEQPVQPGQWEAYHVLCQRSAVPIALDEELIGITDKARKAELLDFIRPPFIILKPTLLGGFHATQEWIDLANARKTGWWITSALESNIGLNAIAQFTAGLGTTLPQGLGTGQLYSNNFASPLFISNGFLNSTAAASWDTRLLVFGA